MLYRYRPRDRAKRKGMKVRLCKILAVGKRRTVEIEFLDNSERVFVDGRALRAAFRKGEG